MATTTTNRNCCTTCQGQSDWDQNTAVKLALVFPNIRLLDLIIYSQKSSEIKQTTLTKGLSWKEVICQATCFIFVLFTTLLFSILNVTLLNV